MAKKQLYPARIYLIHSYGASSATSNALIRQVKCIGSELKHAITRKNSSEFLCNLYNVISILRVVCNAQR